MEAFLSDKLRQELRKGHRTERDRRVADRIKAILLANDGWSHQDIAEALLLDDETISRHIKEYRDNHKLKPENGGSQSKLSEPQKAEFISHLETHTYLKVSDICAYIVATYGIPYTVPGMTCWLKSHGFSYKKPAATPAKADPIKQEAFIQYYEHLMHTIADDEPVLFGDGVHHPTMATKITYGWIRKGTRKPIATTASRTRMNILGSINLEKMDLLTSEHEALDAEAMKKHLKRIRQAYPHAPKIHMIVDNGPYNTCQQTKETAAWGIVMHYLPPYSPNLNPIERCWKIMNEHVRNNRFFGSAKEFREAMHYFFDVTWGNIAWSLRDRVNDNFQRLQSASSG